MGTVGPRQRTSAITVDPEAIAKLPQDKLLEKARALRGAVGAAEANLKKSPGYEAALSVQRAKADYQVVRGSLRLEGCPA